MCALSLAGALQAQQTVEVSWRFGFDNIEPMQGPTPLTILVQNKTTQPVAVEVQLAHPRDFSGEETLRHTLSVSPGVGKQFTFLVRPDSSLNASLVFSSDEAVYWSNADSGVRVPEPVKQFTQPIGDFGFIRGTESLVVVMGGRARQLVSAMGGGSRGAPLIDQRGESDQRVWLCELQQKYAPDNQLGWSGARMVIWTEPDPAGWGDEAQFEALLRWVRCGGQLVILSATQPRLLTAPELRPLLPAAIDGATTVAYPRLPLSQDFNLTRVDESAGAHFYAWNNRSERWTPEGTGVLLTSAGGELYAIRAPGGSTWAELPQLGWQHRLGAGTVRVAAFDPLVYDRGETFPLLQAVSVASGLELRPRTSHDPDRDQMDYGRHQNLQNLLVHGNVLRLSLAPYLLLSLLFLVLIGPVDYFVLKRLNKLKYSAFSLVGYALVFSGAAVVSTYFLFAPSPETNRVAFVDFTELEDGSEFASGHMLHGAYRPLGDSYTCDIEGCQVFGTLWVRPEERDARAGAYVGPGRHPLNVNQPFNSFRMIQTAFAGQPTGTVSARITGDKGNLVLEVSNGLEAPLYGGLLRFAKYAVALPTVDAGETRSIPLPTHLWQHPDGIERRSAKRLGGQLPEGWLTTSDCEELLENALRPEGRFDAISPWRMRLERDDVVFYAVTPAYPFQDSFGEADTGFNATVVRRRMVMPDALRQAIKEQLDD